MPHCAALQTCALSALLVGAALPAWADMDGSDFLPVVAVCGEQVGSVEAFARNLAAHGWQPVAPGSAEEEEARERLLQAELIGRGLQSTGDERLQELEEYAEYQREFPSRFLTDPLFIRDGIVLSASAEIIEEGVLTYACMAAGNRMEGADALLAQPDVITYPGPVILFYDFVRDSDVTWGGTFDLWRSDIPDAAELGLRVRYGIQITHTFEVAR